MPGPGGIQFDGPANGLFGGPQVGGVITVILLSIFFLSFLLLYSWIYSWKKLYSLYTSYLHLNCAIISVTGFYYNPYQLAELKQPMAKTFFSTWTLSENLKAHLKEVIVSKPYFWKFKGRQLNFLALQSYSSLPQHYLIQPFFLISCEVYCLFQKTWDIAYNLSCGNSSANNSWIWHNIITDLCKI